MGNVISLSNTVKAKSARQRQHEKAVLMWRVLRRQRFIQEGRANPVKDHFLRALISHPARYLEASEREFCINMSMLLFGKEQSGRMENQDYVLRLYIDFQKEMSYLAGRNDQFSFDVLFQTIELLGLNKSEASAEETIQQIGKNEDNSLGGMDRERLIAYFRAYNDIARLMKGRQTIPLMISEKDLIIEEAGALHTDISLAALENMFRYHAAQLLLSRKFTCADLLKQWGDEYGFDEEVQASIANLVPGDTPLFQFRSLYARTIQSFRDKPEHEQMDLVFLRTLANFFTSWVMNVSEKIPA